MYVAITRAREQLYLSYATSRKLWGNTVYSSPSSFLREIAENMLIGDIDKIFKNSLSSSFSKGYTLYGGKYKSNYTSSWKDKGSTYTNTPSWAANIPGLKKGEVTKTAVPEVKRERGFMEGERVKSPNHGEGSVTKVEKKDDGKIIVTVVFDTGKQMRFVEGHSDVVKI